MIDCSGIFTQSNFGIVTKIGMTLMPNPGGSEGFVSAERLPDIQNLTNISALRCVLSKKKKILPRLYVTKLRKARPSANNPSRWKSSDPYGSETFSRTSPSSSMWSRRLLS